MILLEQGRQIDEDSGARALTGVAEAPTTEDITGRIKTFLNDVKEKSKKKNEPVHHDAK